MAIEDGLAWLLAVDTAESATSPVWVDLPNQTTVTLEFSNTAADVTHKGSSGWEDEIGVRRAWTLSAEGRSDQDDTAIIYLMDTNQITPGGPDNRVHVRLTDADGDTWIGWATMESFSVEAPEGDVVNFSCSFKGRGSLAVTRA